MRVRAKKITNLLPRMVDWRSGNIPDLSPGYIGGVAVGSNPGRTLAACGEDKSLCVRPVYGLWCAHSFLITCPAALKMGSNCVGCTGHKARLETIVVLKI